MNRLILAVSSPCTDCSLLNASKLISEEDLNHLLMTRRAADTAHQRLLRHRATAAEVARQRLDAHVEEVNEATPQFVLRVIPATPEMRAPATIAHVPQTPPTIDYDRSYVAGVTEAYDTLLRSGLFSSRELIDRSRFSSYANQMAPQHMNNAGHISDGIPDNNRQQASRETSPDVFPRVQARSIAMNNMLSFHSELPAMFVPANHLASSSASFGAYPYEGQADIERRGIITSPRTSYTSFPPRAFPRST